MKLAEPKKIGNAADELGEHLEGADFAETNQGAVPPSIDPLQVELKRVHDNLLIVPAQRETRSLQQGVGELREGSKEILAAAIFEDHKMAKRVSGNIERRTQRGLLQFYAVRETMAAAVLGDRVMIQRDTMESAYSCRHCKGKGHSEAICPTCKGNKIGIDGAEGCRSCKVLGYDREVWHSCGYVQCEFCRGVGSPAGIVIPESAKSTPISGIVVSAGGFCVDLQLGDRVLFSRYAGHEMLTPDGESFFTMHEHEVLQLLKEL